MHVRAVRSLRVVELACGTVRLYHSSIEHSAGFDMDKPFGAVGILYGAAHDLHVDSELIDGRKTSVFDLDMGGR